MLQDAVDRVLRNDGVRVDETEHTTGTGCGSRIARGSAGPTEAGDQSHPSIIGEVVHDGNSSIVAAVVRHDDLEAGVREPEIVASNARRPSDTREYRFQHLTDQCFFISGR